MPRPSLALRLNGTGRISEKLDPPDEAAQARLIEHAFGEKPRIEVWLAEADDSAAPVAYAIFFETYSSFLAQPTLYIEDIFVEVEHRQRGIGSALLRKAGWNSGP